MSNFLPKDYETPESVSNYWNKWEKGQNKFRAMGDAITGWEWWTDEADGSRKPNRAKVQDEVPAEFNTGDRDKDARHFWMFPVYDYGTKAIRILSIKQASIQKQLEAYIKNEDWGDPTEYDVVVDRKGDGFDTEYTVMPSPKKAVDTKVKTQYEGMEINMDALFTGEDPFALDFDKISEEIDGK